MLNEPTKVAALGLAGLSLMDPAQPNTGPIEFEVANSDLHGFER